MSSTEPGVAADLETRSFVAAVDGADLLARPALLSLFATAFGPDDDGTLVVAVSDAAALTQAFDGLTARAGLGPDEVPDVMALPVGPLSSAWPQLAAGIDVVLGVDVARGEAPALDIGDTDTLLRLAAHGSRLAAMRASLPAGLGLPDGYRSRAQPEYFDDPGRADDDIVHQPDVYAAAAALARLADATHIIDIGCGAAEKLLALAPEFALVGLDLGGNLEHCRTHHPGHTWLEWNAERDPLPVLPTSVLRRSVVVCADVIEHLVDPAGLLCALGQLSTEAQAVLVSTPDRERVRGPEDLGPPANAAHVCEWSLSELEWLLSCAGLTPAFSGHTVNNDRQRLKRTSMAIIDPRRGHPTERAPDDFSVTAVIPAFNEADVIEHTIRNLIDDGIHVRLVDNWSTDDTVARVQALARPDMIGIQRFPAHGPSDTYDWTDLLRNTEAIAASIDDGWVIHHDADERRQSPWPDVSLRDALWHVQRCGYDAVDHTVVDFIPTDDEFPSGGDIAAHFHHLRFGTRPGHLLQVKAWRSSGQAVQLAPSGGHDAAFPGRRVFPYKFLLRHYPIRTQTQGERKVFRDRRERRNPDEHELGWHTQYDGIPHGHAFIHPADGLIDYRHDFDLEHLTERLLGVGIQERATVSRDGGPSGGDDAHRARGRIGLLPSSPAAHSPR